MESTEIDGKRYVWVSDMAEEKGVPRITIIKAIEGKRLSVFRKFGLVFIPLAEAEAWQVQQRGGNRGGGRKKKQTSD